jgi:hypothetical protein
MWRRAVSAVAVAAALVASSPVTPASGQAARPAGGAPPAAGVLAPGEPPLTEQMVLEMADALGRLVGSPFTEAETNRLRQRALSRWRRGEGYQDSIRAAHERLRREAERANSFPRAAQPAAWEQANRTLRAEAMANRETFLGESYFRAASVAREQLAPGDPPLWKNAAQAYFEMRAYIAGLAAGRPKQPTTTEILRGGIEVAQAFTAAPEDDRQVMREADRTWVLARANLARLDPAAKKALAARAAALAAKPGSVDLAGRLTPAAVRAFLEESGLLAPVDGFYWSQAPAG